MSPLALLAMLCAAFAAGTINPIAGGGTLLTFPVLIWLGLDPKVANGTSTVALWPGLFGGLFGYRKELHDPAPTRHHEPDRRRVRRMVISANAIESIRGSRSLPHSVRDLAVHVERRGEQTFAPRLAR